MNEKDVFFAGVFIGIVGSFFAREIIGMFTLKVKTKESFNSFLYGFNKEYKKPFYAKPGGGYLTMRELPS